MQISLFYHFELFLDWFYVSAFIWTVGAMLLQSFHYYCTENVTLTLTQRQKHEYKHSQVYLSLIHTLLKFRFLCPTQSETEKAYCEDYSAPYCHHHEQQKRHYVNGVVRVPRHLIRLCP